MGGWIEGVGANSSCGERYDECSTVLAFDEKGTARRGILVPDFELQSVVGQYPLRETGNALNRES